jgi:predicted nucleotidyltransferase
VTGRQPVPAQEQPVDLPPEVAALLASLQQRLKTRDDLVGVYVYGSLATGDYSAASDIDVIVMLETDPDKAAESELRELHAGLVALDPDAKLHCLYVGADNAADAERLRTYWFGDRMTQWQMKLLTQTELTSAGFAMHGPWPPPGIQPVAVPLLQAAVRAEVSGYWSRLVRRRRSWLKDEVVDHALVVLPRAEALLSSGALITKSQAIQRLTADFGVPTPLAREIRRRRDGEIPRLTAVRRLRRAMTARRVMRRGLRRLRRLRLPGG